jgi:hypothetical protein
MGFTLRGEINDDALRNGSIRKASPERSMDARILPLPASLPSPREARACGAAHASGIAEERRLESQYGIPAAPSMTLWLGRFRKGFERLEA